MPTSFNNSGKPTYMYQSSSDTWFAVGAKVDTAAGYNWTGAHNYLNSVVFEEALTARDGINNFLNPAARDAAIPVPIAGTIAFVRQDGSGNPINQLQYYNGSAWVANDGDISAVNAGTGLTGGGTAGSITLSIDSTVATLTGTQTLTNKTVNLANNTLTGTVSQFNTALSDGDFATVAGAETLTNKTLTSPVLTSPEETVNVTGTAFATGTNNIDFVTAGTWFFNVDATANGTLNFRGNSGTALNSILANGQSATIVVLIQNGATPFRPTVFQIDGNAVTPRWQGGTAPTAGNASSIDSYVFSIIKTASATYTVLASQTRFA